MPEETIEVASLLDVFAIVDRPGDAQLWIKCGRAKVARDGSINMRLYVMPLSGILHMRSAEPALGPVELPPPGPLTAADMKSYFPSERDAEPELAQPGKQVA